MSDLTGWRRLLKQQAKRFWANTRRVGRCREWQGALDKDGYGKFTINSRTENNEHGLRRQKHVRSHRAAYELSKGPIPTGMYVLHSCDNPACCEPRHLSVGTQRENRRQASRRGRI
jgi:hypothetical protein